MLPPNQLLHDRPVLLAARPSNGAVEVEDRRVGDPHPAVPGQHKSELHNRAEHVLQQEQPLNFLIRDYGRLPPRRDAARLEEILSALPSESVVRPRLDDKGHDLPPIRQVSHVRGAAPASVEL